MSQSELEALLGRPLTSIEATNLDLYLNIANQRLEDMLCTRLEGVNEERTFSIRSGYHTIFVDIFTEVESVVINGVTLDADDYSPRQWDKRSASWYNSIVLENLTYEDEVTITADWGFDPDGSGEPISTYPADLQLMLAGLFSLVSKQNTTDGRIQSKQVEDFRITFRDTTEVENLALANEATIKKYGLCGLDRGIRHGRVRRFCDYLV